MGARGGKYWLDLLFIGLPLAGAIAAWVYGAPTWLIVIAVILMIVALISFLGDLGVFTGRDPGDY